MLIEICFLTLQDDWNLFFNIARWLKFIFQYCKMVEPQPSNIPEKILKRGIEVIYLEVNRTNFQYYWSFKFDIWVVQFWDLLSFVYLYKTITRMYGTNQDNVRKCSYSFLNISVAIMMFVIYLLKCYKPIYVMGKGILKLMLNVITVWTWNKITDCTHAILW